MRIKWQDSLRAAAQGVLCGALAERNRFLDTWTSGVAERVRRAVTTLRAASFTNPSIATVRALYSSANNALTSDEDLMAELLAATIVGRQNVLLHSRGEKVITVPSNLDKLLNVRNPVAELLTDVSEVSLHSALSLLQWHNASSSDDPFSIQMAAWWEAIWEERSKRTSEPEETFSEVVLRTALVIAKGREKGCMDFFTYDTLLRCPADVAHFIASYSGAVGDCSTQETSHNAGPEDLVQWVWASFLGTC